MKPNTGCFDLSDPDFLGVECAWPAGGLGRDDTAPAAARRAPARRRMLVAALVLALAAGFAQLGHGAYVHARARLVEEAAAAPRAAPVSCCSAELGEPADGPLLYTVSPFDEVAAGQQRL